MVRILPSSSPAACAPPIRNTLLPVFLTGKSKGVKHSWPAHITIVSTCGMNVNVSKQLDKFRCCLILRGYDKFQPAQLSRVSNGIKWCSKLRLSDL